jgi:uncharacterized protein
MKVVYDTNFLMAVLELGLDVVEEVNKAASSKVEHFVLEESIKELETFIKGSLLSKSQAARLAKKYIKTKQIRVIQPTNKIGLVDEELLSMEGFYVATMDKGLRERLKEKNIPKVTIRQKRYVVLD